jgi:hypothetical protein
MLQKEDLPEFARLIGRYQCEGLDKDDATRMAILHVFSDYCDIGGNPSNLLAAVHHGMTLAQFLALPWPPPSYVKKHKQWQDEPLELREARAKHWPGLALWADLVKAGTVGVGLHPPHENRRLPRGTSLQPGDEQVSPTRLRARLSGAGWLSTS